MPDVVRTQIELTLATAPALDEYADAVGATVVARGVNYGTAFEIALKIRELSAIVVEAYSPADLMHGPIAAIRPGWPVILVAPAGSAPDSVATAGLPRRARRPRVRAVSRPPSVLPRSDSRRAARLPSAFSG